MNKKSFIASDETLNAYGYRVLTSGIETANFERNPVMLFNHESMSWGSDVYNGPIGRWENIRKEEGILKLDPVFDEEDPKGKIIAHKVEKGFLRACSMGIRIIETSEDPALMLPGQRRATVTRCELKEVSVVDMPANSNALALYDKSGNLITLKDEKEYESVSLSLVNREQPKIPMKINILKSWAALLAALKISVPEGSESVESEVTADQLSDMNTKLERLSALETEVATLKTDKKAAEDKAADFESKLATANAEIAKLGKQAGAVPKGADAPESEGGGKKESLSIKATDVPSEYKTDY